MVNSLALKFSMNLNYLVGHPSKVSKSTGGNWRNSSSFISASAILKAGVGSSCDELNSLPSSISSMNLSMAAITVALFNILFSLFSDLASSLKLSFDFFLFDWCLMFVLIHSQLVFTK